MSKYKVISTTLKDEAALRAAMEDLKLPFEFLKAPAALYGYKGDVRPEKAHVIIRRHHVGQASNDFGLVKNADGTYQAIMSEYDISAGYGPSLLTRITKRYARHAAVSMAKSKGYSVESESEESDGTVKLRLVKA